MKHTAKHTTLLRASLRSAGWLSAAAWLLTGSARGQEICTEVKLQLSQQLVLSSTVFEATLSMSNETNSLIEDVEVLLSFKTPDGFDAGAHFIAIPPANPTGFVGLAQPGSSAPEAWALGALLPGTSGTAKWIIDPLETAAPTEAVQPYRVGGLLRYTKNGSVVTAPFLPTTIQVAPDARLVLTYYLQDTVYSDDALTPLKIEPSEPFVLGLRILNTGNGTAKALSMSAEQPQIVENVSGLTISFKLIGTQLGCDPVVPAFEVEIGDVGPGESEVVRWVLTSSLKGEFEDLVANFVYVDPLGGQGGEGVVDIQASSTEYMVHSVKLGHVAGSPVSDDTLPDFLVDLDFGNTLIDPFTGKPYEDVPTRVDSSSGESFAVEPTLDVAMDGAPTALDLATVVTADLAFGWNYVRIPDLGEEGFELMQVSRTGPDGLRLSFDVGTTAEVTDVWTTSRTVDFASDPDLIPNATQHLVHVFNHASVPGTYQYDLVYMPANLDALQSDLDLIPAGGGAQQLFLDAGTENALAFYVVLDSLSGSQPGVPIGDGLHLPLNPDSYTITVFNLMPGSSVFVNYFGFLDLAGRATARFDIAGGIDPILAGLRIDHAFVLFDSTIQTVEYTSNAKSVIIAP